MADISFYSDTKKVPNYNSILQKISEKCRSDFKYDENLLNNKEQLLSELYILKGKRNSTKIKIDIFVSKEFINEVGLNRDISFRYIKDLENDIKDIINKEKGLFEFLIKIYRVNRIIGNEILSYIYNKRLPIGIYNIPINYQDEVIDKIISFINESEIIRYFLFDTGGIQQKIFKEKLDKKLINILFYEIKEIKNIINNKKYDLLNFDFNLILEINLDIILIFLIRKYEESIIQVDTTKIEYLFEELSNQSKKEANNSVKNLFWIIGGIILLNICLFFYNSFHPFDYSKIHQYISMILLEIMLFKFMFFFFDKYNNYSKISSMYDYYKGLVQADNIYTTDKKFTAEQNFILREKTYLELTNLSTHLKGIIDKQNSNSKEIVNILKEINNIHPIFKSLNK